MCRCRRRRGGARVRAHDLPIAVRGGGHNVAGKAVCDDAIVIDLSWMKGMRVDPGVAGGGGNFGIVTSFEYRLHPLGQVLGGPVLHPFSAAKEAFEFYRDFSQTAPDELERKYDPANVVRNNQNVRPDA